MRDNLNSTLPAAPAGYANAAIQADTPWVNDPNANRNISFYMPNVGGVSVKTGNYTLVAADCGKLISANSASPLTFTLPAAPPFALWKVLIQNVGAGTLTVSRNGLNIDGAAADLTLNQNQGIIIATDGTNYFTERGMGTSSGGGGIGGVSVKTAGYTLVSGDLGKLVVYNSASAGTFTLPATPPSSTWEAFIENIGAGTLTLSPNGLTLDGSASSLSIGQNQGVYVATDGTNYFTERGMGSGSSAPTGIYAVNMPISGQPSGGSVVLSMFVFTEAVNFASNWAGSFGKVLTNPTVAQTWTINKNGSSVGSIGISTGGVVTFTSSGTISFAAGDLLTIVGSASVDTTLSNVVVDFQGIKASLTATPTAVLAFSWLGQPASSQVIGQYVFTTTLTFPGNWSGAAFGKVNVNPAASWVADLRKNGSSVGSVTVSTSGVFTFASTGGNPVTFNAGDEMTAVAPATVDTALQYVAFSFSGSAGGFVQLSGDLGGTTASPKVIGVNGNSIGVADDTGAANAYAVTTPYPFSLTVYSTVVFKAAHANTGSSTLAVNGGSAITIMKAALTNLASGDITIGQVVIVIYDGTNWQMVSWSGGGGGGSSVPIAISMGPDWPPAVPGSLDDEFTGASLSGAWTWVNQGSATATLSKSTLTMVCPTSATTNWRYIYQTAPATPWEVQAKCVFLAGFPTNFWSSGIVLSDSSGKIIHWGPSVSLTLKVQYYNSPTSFNSTPSGSNPASSNIGLIYLRVQDDGTNLTFWFSLSGAGWQQFAQYSRTALLASGPTRVGLGVDSENSQIVMLDSDWFRRTV